MQVAYKYHPQIPSGCPVNARPADCTVYRAIKKLPVCADHFLSDVESNKPNNKPSECSHWGCSVMFSEAGVHHARSLFSHFRTKRYFVRGDLCAADGEVAETPSVIKDHMTFWKVFGHDVSDKFTLYLAPDPS
jgi:hypothetical protein